MKHLRLAAWTVWFMLSWVALAHAGPIAAAVGAVATFLASGTALANIAVGLLFTAAKIGISLLMKAEQTKQVAGVQADTKFGGDNPLSFVMGTFATPGQLEYANTWGDTDKTPNAYLVHVISIGDLPMNLTGLWVDDQKVTLPTMTGTPPFTSGWPISEFTKSDGDHQLVALFHDGTQTTADSYLLAKLGDDPDRPWQSDMIGRGVPLLITTAQFDRSLFNGIPQYLAETSGIAQYDPREDTSVGGDGDQRWSDPSTWVPSDNPIVQVYNILRGIYFDGEWIWGGRCESWQLPLANWMAMMNVCDTLITNADASTEKQFRSGLEITTDQEPADVIEDILKGCNGRIGEIGGVYKVLVGAPSAAVYSFTDETIIVTEGQSLDPFPGLESTFNGAQASYPEPAEKWAAKDAPAYLRSDLEALDDDRRLVSGLQYPTVPYALQVQRLLQTAVQDARRFRVHQIVLPPEAWLLEPNDVVSWTSTWNGYEEKKFIVTEIEGDSNFLQYVTLKEIDPADYSWDASTDEQSYSVGFIGTIVPAAQQMTGWQVAPATLKDGSGVGRRPSIQVSFDGDLDDVQAVRVQVRLAIDDSIVFDGSLPYGDPATNSDPKSIILNGTFLPDEDYEVRGIFSPYSGRSTIWSNQSIVDGEIVDGDWLPVTTPNVQFTSADILDGAITELKLAAEAVSTAKMQVAAVTADILGASSVTNQKIADEAITRAKVAAKAISATEIDDDAITTPKLAAGAVTAVKIAANSISARELILSDFDNLVPDNQLTSMANWLSAGGSPYANFSITSAANANYNSNNLIRWVPTGKGTGYSGVKSARFPVKPSAEYYAEIQCINTVSKILVYVVWLDASGNNLGNSLIINQVTNPPLNNSAVFTSPSGSHLAEFQMFVQQDSTTANVWFAGPMLKERNAANLVVDGGITAVKIAALSITGDKIAAGTITAAKMQAGTITAASGIIADAAITSPKLMELEVMRLAA